MPLKTAPEDSSPLYSTDDLKTALLDAATGTLNYNDKASRRTYRQVYTFLKLDVPVAYLMKRYDRADSTLKIYARKGRFDIENKDAPWHFLPSRVKTKLHKEMLEFTTPESFAVLLANIDDAQDYIFTPMVVEAVKMAAAMPGEIEEELAMDRRFVRERWDEIVREVAAFPRCAVCAAPLILRHSYFGPYCRTCIRTDNYTVVRR